jgi:hypothetical protein
VSRQLHAFLERACQREKMLKVWSIMVVNEDGDKVTTEVAHK